MAIKNKQQLDEILQNLGNREKGYREAAQRAEDPALKQFCFDHAVQASSFVDELSRFMIEAGETPNADGTIGGALHRLWLDIRETLGTADDENIIKEILRGERTLADTYQDALETDLPEKLRTALYEQYQKLQRVIEYLTTMQPTKSR